MMLLKANGMPAEPLMMTLGVALISGFADNEKNMKLPCL